MLEDVEAVRVVLERTFLKPVTESDARIVMDRLNELLDSRSPTLRAAVQSEQGGQHLDSSYDEYEGTTFNPKKVSARPNRSDGS